MHVHDFFFFHCFFIFNLYFFRLFKGHVRVFREMHFLFFLTYESTENFVPTPLLFLKTSVHCYFGGFPVTNGIPMLLENVQSTINIERSTTTRKGDNVNCPVDIFLWLCRFASVNGTSGTLYRCKQGNK